MAVLTQSSALVEVTVYTPEAVYVNPLAAHRYELHAVVVTLPIVVC